MANMFFVSGEKVYLSEYNSALKAYPEVKLTKTSDDQISAEVQASGIAKKPSNRQLCTLSEILAQFGAGASKKRTETKR